MSTLTRAWDSAVPGRALATGERNWYALLTRARHERIVAQRFHELGVTVFLPTIIQERRWSDRKLMVEFPLFSCYVFAKLCPTNEARLRAIRVGGVCSLVGRRGEGTPIPDEEIDAVRRVTEEHLQWHSHPSSKSASAFASAVAPLRESRAFSPPVTVNPR